MRSSASEYSMGRTVSDVVEDEVLKMGRKLVKVEVFISITLRVKSLKEKLMGVEEKEKSGGDSEVVVVAMNNCKQEDVNSAKSGDCAMFAQG
ncbi:uncharacterized protein G2W53_037032 [Senna tora]|uniref:Uncharacterized protein n=1 Tax=Senna tora TaxID=362788 RepID=A0A834WAS0_9FABA|nr:uncharacterized protein G2W53_037032 [Senna tora]